MKDILRQFGLSSKESESYLKLLELGAQPVSVLAKQMAIARSSMYSVVERLIDVGLIEEFQRHGMKYIRCIPVKSIQHLLDDRRQKIENLSQMLQARMPELQALENKLVIKPNVKFFEDKKSVIKMYFQVLEEKEFVAFQNVERVKNFMTKFYDDIPMGIKKKRGRAREILVDSQQAREYKDQYQTARHQMKILKPGVEFFSDTIVAGEKIYMVSYGEKVSAIEIWDKALADSQRLMFDLIWDVL